MAGRRVVPETGDLPGTQAPGGTWQLCTKVCRTQSIWVMVLKGCLAFFLVLVTPYRIALNVEKIRDPTEPKPFYGDRWPLEWQLLDGILRPVLSFLSMVPFVILHYSSWREFGPISGPLLGSMAVAICCLGVEFQVAFDPPLAEEDFDVMLRFLRIVSLTLVAFAQLLELRRFKVAAAAMGAFVAAMAFAATSGLAVPREADPMVVRVSDIFFWSSWFFYSALSAFALIYEARVKQQIFRKKHSNDEEFKKNVTRTLQLLWFGGHLTLLDGAYFALTSLLGEGMGLSRSMEFTIDNVIVLLCMFVKGGWLSPATIDPLQVLHELDYLSFTHGKRIAFPGKMNPESLHCIVSFPGKYADEWDAAVRMTQTRPGACSLACVFLTDEKSGLGRHQENPEQPGNCWCKAIYGRLSAAAYLSIVEDSSAITEEELKFKETDAQAMGQIFLKRDGQSDDRWQKDKDEAKQKAAEKCSQNHGVAPWGCLWFHLWLQRVEGAKAHSQTLHVFYFENKVGCGKLPWQELSNETSVKKARENSGLGTSQTAEVAYLQHRGYHFEEHDVKDFYEFVHSHSS